MVSKFKLGHMEYNKIVLGLKKMFGSDPRAAKVACRKRWSISKFGILYFGPKLEP